MSGGRQRQQAHGSQHREASAHVVGNDERRVALVVGERLQRAARLVGDGHDAFGGFLLAVTLFDLGFDQAEGDGRFGRGSRLGDDDRGDRVLLHGFEQFVGVILRDVLACEHHDGFRPLLVQELERIAHGFEHGLGAQIRAADADADDHFGLFAELRGLLLDGFDPVGRDRRGQVHPAEEVAAGTLARFEQGVGRLRLGLHCGRNRNARFGDV